MKALAICLNYLLLRAKFLTFHFPTSNFSRQCPPRCSKRPSEPLAGLNHSSNKVSFNTQDEIQDSHLSGHQIPVQHHERPGLQSELEGPKPTNAQLPTEDNGYQTYKAAGKLTGKRAIITGGDSGIGRATAILYAMEGATSLITYLPQEQSDADETKRRVEELGQKCYLFATDLRGKENCKKVVDAAVKEMGGIDILVNNAGTQNMIEDIKDLEE